MTEPAALRQGTRVRPRVRHLGRWLALTIAYTTLAVWDTWPQASHLSRLTAAHHDSLFSVWRLSWIAHALQNDPSHLFDANIFYPSLRTLAYSDAVLLPGVVLAPVLAAGASPLVVYNVTMLAAFVLCALSGAFLGWRLTGRFDAAALCGLVFGFAPPRFEHFAHLELQLNWWLPLLLVASERAIATGRWRSWAAMGLCGTAQVLSCIYHSLLFAPYAAVDAALHIVRTRPRLARLAGAVWLVLPVLVLAAYSQPYRENRTLLGDRPWGDVVQYSAEWTDFGKVEQQNVVWGTRLKGGYNERTLFPTVTAIMLALTALTARGRLRKVALHHAVLLVVAVDLARGANGVIFPLLYDHVPGFSGLRVPARAGLLGLLSLAALAAVGWARLAGAMRPAIRRAVWVVVCTAFIAESAPRLNFRTVERPARLHDIVAAHPSPLLLELPVSVPGRLDINQDAVFMYESIGRWYPLVNGYSGYYSPAYLHTLDELRRFPVAQARRYVARLGVTHVLLHERNWAGKRSIGQRSFGQTVEGLLEAGWPALAYEGRPGSMSILFAVPPSEGVSASDRAP